METGQRDAGIESSLVERGDDSPERSLVTAISFSISGPAMRLRDMMGTISSTPWVHSRVVDSHGWNDERTF